MRRRLIVNADDFGFTRDVNAGIVEAFQRGILRSTTLMANGRAFDDAVALTQANPGLDVGCHLVLIGGPALADPRRSLSASIPELLLRLAAGLSVAAIEEEFAAQVEKLQAAGVRPSHLDTHKHTHLVPRVLDALVRVARRYDIAWVRKPFDTPLTAAAQGAPRGRRIVQRCLRPLERGFQRTLGNAGLRSTDAFAGFQITGSYRTAELAALIGGLPQGVTELMCHPGRCGDELRAASTRLKQSREQELAALLSDEVRRAVEESGVELCDFRQLTPPSA